MITEDQMTFCHGRLRDSVIHVVVKPRHSRIISHPFPEPEAEFANRTAQDAAKRKVRIQLRGFIAGGSNSRAVLLDCGRVTFAGLGRITENWDAPTGFSVQEIPCLVA